MEIRRLDEAEAPLALSLALDVFLEFVAPDYPAQGVETFRAFVSDPDAAKTLRFYGAFEDGDLAGVIAARGAGHVSLFFVRRAYQKRGVGRALFEAFRRDCQADVITVHSSPYARAVYEKLGFTAVCSERLTDGIRYVPMKYVQKVRGESI